MRRYGRIIKIRPEKEAYYKKLHANAWQGVLDTITECNIKNYSIFLRDGFLFAYFEYVGDDYDSDMKKMAACPVTKEWWIECDPCQQPIETAAEGEWWVDMEEVFHYD